MARCPSRIASTTSTGSKIAHCRDVSYLFDRFWQAYRLSCSPCPLPRRESDAVRRLGDEVRHGLRLRHVHRVAALDLDDGRAGALGHGALRIRRNHLVFGRAEVPAWLRL